MGSCCLTAPGVLHKMQSQFFLVGEVARSRKARNARMYAHLISGFLNPFSRSESIADLLPELVRGRIFGLGYDYTNIVLGIDKDMNYSLGDACQLENYHSFVSSSHH